MNVVVIGLASGFLFLALVTGAVALLAPMGPSQRPLDQRVRALRSGGGQHDRVQNAAPVMRRSRSALPRLGPLLADSRWAEAMATELRQANFQLRVGEYLLGRLLLALLFLIVPVLLLRSHPIALAVAPAAGVIGYLLPAVYVRSARRRRIARIERQLIEFLPALASSLRSGFALQHGIEAAAHQLGPPLAGELLALLNDVNLGATMEVALRDLGRRVSSKDLEMVITAIVVQRTTGGNLAEVLDQAAETLRERERIRGDLQTFTAQQRLTGTILSVYPLAVGLLLLALMPSIWSRLFTETAGQVQLAIAAGLQLVGFLAMRRVLNIEI